MSSSDRARPWPLRAVGSWGIAAIATLISSISVLTVASSLIDVATYIALPLAFGGIGAFLATRVPGNPIGPLLLLATAGFAALVGCFTWLGLNAVGPTTDPIAIAVGLVANVLFLPSLVLVLVGIPLVFPDGHLLSPRWRWVAVATAALVMFSQVRNLLATADLVEPPFGPLRNPLYLPGADEILATIDGLETLVGMPLFFLALSSLVLRYRRSDDVGRHQIRWFAAASTVAVVAYGISFVVPQAVEPFFATVGTLALNTVPLAIGVAVVRYRLYEIDRLISRGISYAVVSVVLLGAYAAVVLLLQGPIGTLFGTQTVTVAVSTLIVAALFQPLRRRVQRAVDRRFDRAHVDAERTTAAFSERLREQVDIDTVVEDLASTARAAVSPATIQLWLRNLDTAARADRSA